MGKEINATIEREKSYYVVLVDGVRVATADTHQEAQDELTEYLAVHNL